LQLANAADMRKQQQQQQQQLQQQLFQNSTNGNNFGSYSSRTKSLFGDMNGLSWLAGNIEQLTEAQQKQFDQQQALK
jgi:hypothetical protein